MEDKIIRYRWPIIIGFILITLFFGLQIPKATIQSDFKTYIPESVPARVNTAALEEIFGGSNMVMILFKTEDVLNPVTLKRVSKLSRKFGQIKGVNQVMSLFDAKDIRGEDGMMIVEPAVNRIPKTPEQREKLKERLRSNDMVYKLVVSSDFTMTAIILSLDEDVEDKTIIDEIHSKLEEIPGSETVSIGGQPQTSLSIANDIARDFIYLMPLALVLMLLILLITFRQLRGVLLPISVVIMSIVFSMGLQVTFGWDLTILSILLPIMLIAIANNYGIHLVARYQELNCNDGFETKESLVKEVVSSIKTPVLLTGLTTIAGVLGLLSHIMIPAKRLGVMAAFGISYALLLSLFFLPAVMSLLRRKRPDKKRQRHGKFSLEKTLLSAGNTVANHPKRVMMIMGLISIILIIGISLLHVDSNIINFFPKNHPTHVTADIINKYFGGSENLDVMIEGDIKDPTILKHMDYIGKELEKSPDVSSVTSLATVIKAMSRALNDPSDPGYNHIPDTRETVAQYLELYNMSGDPEDFEKIVDFNYEHAQMIIRICNPNASAISKIVSDVEKLSNDFPEVKYIGGESMVVAEMMNIVVRGQMISLLVAIIVIAILVMLMFRSPVAGFLAAIPLTVAIILVFGLMGYLKIRLDIVTAMLSSIMIGVGVDYTIHFLWRYQQERQNGNDYGQAVVNTLTTTGRGITFNALSVIIGFGALMLSVFPPIKFFGFLVVMSIFSCVIGALVLIPAMCIVFKPKFLEPKL